MRSSETWRSEQRRMVSVNLHRRHERVSAPWFDPAASQRGRGSFLEFASKSALSRPRVSNPEPVVYKTTALPIELGRRVFPAHFGTRRSAAQWLRKSLLCRLIRNGRLPEHFRRWAERQHSSSTCESNSSGLMVFRPPIVAVEGTRMLATPAMNFPDQPPLAVGLAARSRGAPAAPIPCRTRRADGSR